MTQRSPESPEARRVGAIAGQGRRQLSELPTGRRVWEVLRRVVVGTYSDGFTHAGNLAYLSLVTLFPFFIVAAAVARRFGRTDVGLHALRAFLRTVPPGVADVLRKPIVDVLAARSGSLLWFGALVGLWTTAGFIETIRSILRRAYGVDSTTPFWRYRLGAIGLIVGAVVLVMAAFGLQIVLTAVEAFIVRVLPFASDVARALSLSRLAPAIALFIALYILLYILTPPQYRKSKCPKWPGAAFTAAWWMAVTALLPRALDAFTNYDLTYGSLAGVMVVLIFFFLVGLGLVIGAELNAALAEVPENGLEDSPKAQKPETP